MNLRDSACSPSRNHLDQPLQTENNMLALDVIFVAFSAVAVTRLDKYNLPEEPKHPEDSAVRIAVAINTHDPPLQADGTFPAILAYNELGDHIGSSDWTVRPHIESGGYDDVTVDQRKGPGQQATYLQFFAGTDAVCVAYIAQTWADGQMRGWLGDMGRACGRPYHYSNIIVGEDGHSPDCMWLDADHSEPQGSETPVAVQIHMQDYTNLSADYNKDPAHYCDQRSITFKNDLRHEPGFNDLNFKKGPPKHPTLFTGSPGQGPCCYDKKRTKRQQEQQQQQEPQPQPQPRSPSLAKTLISSPREKHSAIELCASETSYGPDFVSRSERVFCDMGTKVAWPLCGSGGAVEMGEGEEEEGECYRWETHSLVTGGEHVARNYEKVEEWE